MSILLKKALENDTIIVITVLALSILVSVGIVLGLKQFEKKNSKMLSKREPKKMNLKLNNQYITQKEFNFLNVVYKALPSEFIAFPKVPIANILSPGGDKVSYNLVADKIIDICIFEKETMKPLLAVDLYEPEATSFAFNKLDDIGKKALISVKIPLVEMKVTAISNVEEIRRTLLSAMPNTIVTMLKDKIIKG